MTNKRLTQAWLILLITALMLAFPVSAYADEVDPPSPAANLTDYEGEKLVFEPEFSWIVPFGYGFEISFRFAIVIQVPTELLLMDENAFNFFLRFRSYRIPAEGEPE